MSVETCHALRITSTGDWSAPRGDNGELSRTRHSKTGAESLLLISHHQDLPERLLVSPDQVAGLNRQCIAWAYNELYCPERSAEVEAASKEFPDSIVGYTFEGMDDLSPVQLERRKRADRG